MTPSVPVLAVALLVLAGGLAAVVQRRKSLASWSFLLGMVVLALESILKDGAQSAGSLEEQSHYYGAALVMASFLPGCWLCFSLTYSRGDAREVLHRFRGILVLAVVLPVGLAIGFRNDLFGPVDVPLGEGEPAIETQLIAKVLVGMLLLAAIAILVNLERTLRAAVGTGRWRVKYLFIGACVIFGTRIFTLSQVLLFSAYNPAMDTVETVALLLGTLLFAIAYLRRGFGSLEIYPSRTVLHRSFTFVLAAGYLVVVGVLGHLVASLGGMTSFTAQAFVLMLGMVGLAVLLLSDRLRDVMHGFVTRHFHRPRYDVRALWNRFTEETSGCVDRSALGQAAASLVSGTFEIMSVRLFLRDGPTRRWTLCASTAEGEGSREIDVLPPEAEDSLRHGDGLVDIAELKESWALPLREACPRQFEKKRGHFVLPLVARDQVVGFMLLTDHVGGRPFSREEQELLKCLADQLAAALLNQTLTEEAAQARELQAFQTMSTFFVHDLKNAANSLGLMLQNLPDHFNDPEFREDALRAIGKAVQRINHMIAKLSALREQHKFDMVRASLNSVVAGALDGLEGTLGHVDLITELDTIPKINLDPEQMESVVTNLVANAAEAVDPGGQVRISTTCRRNQVILEVHDNGSGMSPEFVRTSLFRPFQSTKSRGLGVGMFQSKLIVEAHQGSIEVESEPNRGSTFRILLPVADEGREGDVGERQTAELAAQ